MTRPFWLAVPVLLLVLAAPLAGAEGIKIGKRIPYADGVGRSAIRDECDLENHLTATLVEYGKGRIERSAEDLKKAQGKVFDAQITGVWGSGGPYGGASVLVEGQLRDNGKVIGTVTARRKTSRGGYGTCGKVNLAAGVVAKDIAAWLEAPSMDARLGDAGK